MRTFHHEPSQEDFCSVDYRDQKLNRLALGRVIAQWVYTKHHVVGLAELQRRTDQRLCNRRTVAVERHQPHVKFVRHPDGVFHAEIVQARDLPDGTDG
eukprot:COSAG06_NODE_551_length_14398_cov_5.447304_7_plen_98_part_00